MLHSRIDWSGAGLAAAALIVLWLSYDARRESARWYAETAAYNRSMTEFVVEQQSRLRTRPVAVLGLTGLSPWSHTNGEYLSRLIGAPVEWHVFVPRENLFYAFGKSTRPPGVSVHPEAEACVLLRDRNPLYLVFDAHGRGDLAMDCESALNPVAIAPTLEAWGPMTVTAAQADAGFNMYFIGTDLVAGVEVSINGMPLPMARAKRGRLMTTAIPPKSAVDGAIRFSVDQRGTSVFSGQVVVSPGR